jgi:hypothetical protein
MPRLRQGNALPHSIYRLGAQTIYSLYIVQRTLAVQTRLVSYELVN